MKKGAVLVLAVLLVATGCATSKPSAAPGQEKQSATKAEMPNVTYYTFPDIPVPKELELIRDRSFVYETPNLKTGVLVLSGNVDMDSMEQYFRANMAKNGWRFISNFKYATVILNYVKDDRAALIRLSRENFSTVVEIWVGPRGKPGGMESSPEKNEPNREG